MFIELIIKNLAAMTYYKFLRFEIRLKGFFWTKKIGIFSFWILDSEILISW